MRTLPRLLAWWQRVRGDIEWGGPLREAGDAFVPRLQVARKTPGGEIRGWPAREPPRWWVQAARGFADHGERMRQALHILVGLAFWLMLGGLWTLLVVDGKVTATAFWDTLLQLAVIVGVVLAITTWWIRHNVGIYRRKGPRKGRASIPPRVDEDRLGRRLRWAMPGGVHTARAQRHLVVELDGETKTYRRGA